MHERRTTTQSGLLRGHEHLVGAFQRLLDVSLIGLAHFGACWLYGDSWRQSLNTVTLVAALVFMLTAEFNGIYRPWRSEPIWREIGEVLLSWLAVPTVLVVVGFATKLSTDYSRVVSALWFTGAPVLMAAVRMGGRFVLGQLRAHGRNLRHVAVLGVTETAERLCDHITTNPWLGLNLQGLYDDRGEHRRHSFRQPLCKFAGRVDDLIRDARESKIDIVYIALPLRAEGRVAEVLRELADTTATVFLLADFFTYDLIHGRWSQMGPLPMVSIYDSPFQGVAGWMKRVEDIVVGFLIVLLISVPLTLIAISIKLTSRGPVFFRQRRYGLNGKEIRILKFRSMTVMEDGPDVKQVIKGDKRVTKLGAILRKYSLDELPQFLQVLTGEMSIVGPRPHAVSHNEQYRALIHGYMLRHKVKPGITGWAQVNGWRGETDELGKMEKRIQHDLEYIQNWHLLLDLKIIFLTVFGTKKNRNAY